MPKYKIVWEERHSAIIEAKDYKEAQEKANELNIDIPTYDWLIDQTIKEI